MSEQTPDEPTGPASESDAGRAPDGTEGWTGGQREQNPSPEDADVEDLPDLEMEEDSVVKPQNS